MPTKKQLEEQNKKLFSVAQEMEKKLSTDNQKLFQDNKKLIEKINELGEKCREIHTLNYAVYRFIEALNLTDIFTKKMETEKLDLEEVITAVKNSSYPNYDNNSNITKINFIKKK